MTNRVTELLKHPLEQLYGWLYRMGWVNVINGDNVMRRTVIPYEDGFVE